MLFSKNANPTYKPTEFRGWAGMNNRLPPEQLGATQQRLAFLRNAVNVTFDDAGHPRLREGVRKMYSGSGCRSLFAYGDRFMFAEGTDVKQFDPAAGTAVTMDTGADATRGVAFVNVNGEVYWSDGLVTGKIGDTRWGLPLAPAPLVVSMADGGLAAGRYHVAVTNVYGAEESGAGRLWPVDVPDGGGIGLTGLSGTSRVYVTQTNGELALLHGTTTEPSYIIGVSSTLGMQLRFLRCYPFPACDILAYVNGRIWGAKDNVAYYSMALQYRLYEAMKGFVPFESEIQMLAPVRTGIYISDMSSVYYFATSKDVVESRLQVLNYPAIKGTFCTIPTTPEGEHKVAWFSQRGWVIAGDSASVMNITDTNIAVQDKLVAGAATWRSVEGRKELISSLERSGLRDGGAVGDFIEAEVIRNGRRI